MYKGWIYIYGRFNPLDFALSPYKLAYRNPCLDCLNNLTLNSNLHIAISMIIMGCRLYLLNTK